MAHHSPAQLDDVSIRVTELGWRFGTETRGTKEQVIPELHRGCRGMRSFAALLLPMTHCTELRLLNAG